MQVPGSDNAGPGCDILEPELMSEEKKKANGKMLGLTLLFKKFSFLSGPSL